MPFFLDDKRGAGLAVGKKVKILVLDRSGIFIYFRPRDLDFPRVIGLELLLFPEKGLKEGDISWEKG
jgi:hypothetical protein